MNIGFDISDLCTNREDGTTRYTRELAKRLPVWGKGHEWLMYAPCSSPKITPGRGNARVIPSPWPKYWTQTRLPLDLYRYKPDVLLMPIQQIPYFRPGKMKTAAVVHDLAFHYYPRQFRRKDWLLLHAFTAYAVRQADELITVSKSTADDVAKFYNRTASVHVVRHGVDKQKFRPPSPEEKERSWEQLTNKYPRLKKPYLVYVGQLQPRKNLARLIRAFEKISEKNRNQRLVLGGGHGWLKQPIIKAVKNSPAADNILLPGIILDELLPALYWHAEVFVLPSLYEGFGLPILEAFACGCPVVTSNVSSLPEVAGDAAVLVDPSNTSGLAEGISEALNNKEMLAARGLRRAKQFDWNSTARQILKVIT